MMIRIFRAMVAGAWLGVVGATAAPAAVLLPGDIALHRAGQTHWLVAEGARDGLFTGDRTAEAGLVSSNPEVALVSPEGQVTAIANGEAIISGTLDGVAISARVTVAGVETPFVYSFSNHVQPLMFKMGCNTGPCHGSQSGRNGFRLSLRGFDNQWDHNAITRQASARRVNTAMPEDSLLLLKPIMDVAHEGGERFTKDSEAYRILLAWIQAGAPGEQADDPVVERIEVYPRAATLGLSGTQRIIVQAHYSDGTYEDVSPWAKYETTEDAVALVSEEGVVSVAGSGSGAITVWYASKLASVEISVPRAQQVDPALLAASPRHNFIDDLVIKKLESLQIPVAAQADDATFVRRAYLDTLGVLPKPEEVRDFLQSADPDKRAALINTLLDRPEYVDYWSYKWSDLLLLSSKNLPRGEELNAFYRYIREGVAENVPWDQFVRGIITARGNTVENGAGAYYVMHKEIADLTETTSQAFLGMSVTCARCHNHPLEKWTQDDYYGMANLLSRVKLKNGSRPGSTEVLAADFGDVIHPRIGAPMPPKPLDGDALALDSEGDRREYLAAWLTAPENPYFTKAIVNRVWKNFMGRGLVESEDDLRLTNPPTNAELMDALAADLAAHAFDLKHLMRTIMNSAAYQRSSVPADPEAPDDRFYSHYIVRRLGAEVLLDAYAQVTGVPTPFSGYPSGTRALQLRDSQTTIYFLTAFGRPERKQTCSCERTEDATIAQTLHLANGDTLNKKLRNENAFLRQLIAQGVSDYDAVNRLYVRALGRYPSIAEAERAVDNIPQNLSDPVALDAARAEAFEDLAWALMSSKEFLFNH